MNQQPANPFENEMFDGVLQSAIASLQEAPVPVGPPPQLVAGTLRALDESDAPRSSQRVIVPMTKTMKILTTIAALLLAVCTLYLFTPAVKSPSSAFGQAIREVREAKSMSYTELIFRKNKSEPIKSRVFIAEDGRRRSEMIGEGGRTFHTTVFDANGQIRIALSEERTKTAYLGKPHRDSGTNAGVMFLAWLEDLKELGDKPDQELGQKELDGKHVTGFVAKQGNIAYTIWVDNASGQVARLEYDSPVNDAIGHIVMTDFRFDEALDESLFSFEVPTGYKIYQPTSSPAAASATTLSGEENILEALRGYTKRSDGKFPASIADWGSWAVLFSKGSAAGQRDDDSAKVMGHLGAILPFLTSMPKSDYAYLGDGKTVEDTDAVVFWYKKPDGSYRAIYGDLSAKDITAPDLPKK